ncbi:MAG: hypothetical protein C4524_15345 [Candidatus Zixiibacteriota bacterium]|nr:MAG: hypothetical protein C4524_15345 [candidate division Zixibacteria bacterium]
MPYIILVLGWILTSSGCSGGKMASLEDQLAEERARRAALQAQMEFLNARLEEEAGDDSMPSAGVPQEGYMTQDLRPTETTPPVSPPEPVPEPVAQTPASPAPETADPPATAPDTAVQAMVTRDPAPAAPLEILMVQPDAVVLEQDSIPPPPTAVAPEDSAAAAAPVVETAIPEPAAEADPAPAVSPPPEPQTEAPAAAPPAAGDFRARYDAALALFHEKKFTRSAQAFRALLEADRGHDLSDNCQFWLGECYYALRQYEAARAEFEKVFIFPWSNKLDAAQYKLALCHLQLERYDEARTEFNRLLTVYPASEYLDLARAHLAKLP